ncbi:hypothetical protein D3C77_585760 [compost metagenome]
MGALLDEDEAVFPALGLFVEDEEPLALEVVFFSSCPSNNAASAFGCTRTLSIIETVNRFTLSINFSRAASPFEIW